MSGISRLPNTNYDDMKSLCEAFGVPLNVDNYPPAISYLDESESSDLTRADVTALLNKSERIHQRDEKTKKVNNLFHFKLNIRMRDERL